MQGGEQGIISVYSSLQWMDGNIDADPQFTQTIDHPFQLEAGSPCVDAGTPDTTGMNLPAYDIMGNIRIWNGRIDMGAYEWNNIGFEEFKIQNSEFKIHNYPNPTRGISYFLFLISQYQYVTVNIYDVHGREGAIVLDKKMPAGEHVVSCNLSGLPEGIYFVRVMAGQEAVSGKVLLVR